MQSGRTTPVFDTTDEAQLTLLREAVMRRPDSATLQFRLADALAKRGEDDEFAQTFRRAYLLSPSAPPWLKRMEARRSRDGALQLLARARALAERGVLYSPVIAALAIARARLGDAPEVARLVDYERFFRCFAMAPPPGLSREDFHAALADEIRPGLEFCEENTNKPLRQGWRRKGLLRSELLYCRALERELRAHVERYIAQLHATPDHPFVASCPREFLLGGWAVVTSGPGHIHQHMHPLAWLSGVYYVSRPAASRDRNGKRGWLHVGPPTEIGIKPSDGWQERIVEPEPGNLVLMPSYFFHQLAATDSEEERISIAFDVIPVELAGALSALDGY
jgi:uncharacterized protein (TIGR02466 family)